MTGKPIAERVNITVSAGELLDKLAILEIKSRRMTSAEKLRNVQYERDVLQACRVRQVPNTAELAQLESELLVVNESLWDIEDRIRHCESEDNFGPEFIELARHVYQTNDHRAAIKRRINELLGSALVEEKDYDCPAA